MPKKINFKGLDIRIEFAKGERKPDGDPFTDDNNYGWPMYADYGYIEGTFANDQEEIDVYIGEDRESDEVFIATLLKHDEDGGDPEIDEWKVLLGFESYSKVQRFMNLQYGSHMTGVIYRSSLEDINLTAELSRLAARKELLFVKDSQEPKLTLPEFQEIGQYGGTPNTEKLIMIS